MPVDGKQGPSGDAAADTGLKSWPSGVPPTDSELADAGAVIEVMLGLPSTPPPPFDCDNAPILPAALPFDAGAGRAAPARSAALESGGGFVLIRHHGRGGLGEVSVAEDQGLGRHVAVKQIRPELADDPGSRRRFVHEARITGQLEHPSIVPVHAAGTDTAGRPFYAMKLVNGRTLERAISDYHAGPRPSVLRDLLTRFVAVCQAIAYAHSRGVIHRDLKPANIMLGEYGETMILDWGLAKRFAPTPPGPRETTDERGDDAGSESEARGEPPRAGAADFGTPGLPELDPVVTSPGQVVGTPAYMPPKQADGRAEHAGPAADVYSLGAVLSQLLTGQPPGGETATSGSEPAHDRPAAPSAPARHVPRALAAVCRRAMALRPEDRYPSAAEFGREVERWLADDPVRTWREPALVGAARWARRHKPLVAGGVALFATLAVALAVNNILVRAEQVRTEAARKQAEASEAEAVARREEARSEAREARLQYARGLVFQGNTFALARRYADAKERYGVAREKFTSIGVSPFPADIGLWDADRSSPPPLVEFRLAGRGGLGPVAVAVDGFTALTGGRNGSLAMFDVRAGRRAWQVAAHTEAVTAVALSADGRLAASAAEDGAVKVWDVNAGGTERSVLPRHGRGTTVVAFLPDGRVVSGGADGNLKVWDVGADAAVRTFATYDGGVTAVAASADGRTVVSGGRNGVVQVWDLGKKDGAPVPLRGHGDYVSAVAVSADGQVVLSGSGDTTLRLWSVPKREQVGVFQPGHDETVTTVALSLDGKTALSGDRGKDGTVRLWNTDTRRESFLFAGHHGPVTGVALSADGRSAIAVGEDDVLRVWDLTEPGVRTFRGHDEFVMAVAFSPDHRTAASGGADRFVRIWDVATGQELRSFPGHGKEVTCVAFSLDGARLASGDAEGNIRVFHLWPGADPPVVRATKSGVTAIAFSTDGRTIIFGGANGAVWLWDADGSGELRALPGHSGPVAAVASSPDGRHAASGGLGGSVRVWDVASLRLLHELTGLDADVCGVAFMPDGRSVLAGSVGGTLKRWDLQSRAELPMPGGGGNLTNAMAFTPDGQTVLFGSFDAALKLRDVESGLELTTLNSPGNTVSGLAFASDGQSALTGSDKTVVLWQFDRPARRRLLAPRAVAAMAALGDRPSDGAGAASRPADGGAFAALAEWYEFHCRYDWALDAAGRAAGAPVPHLLLARCHWMQGDVAAARREFTTARAANDAPAEYLDLCLHALENGSRPPSPASAAEAPPTRRE